MAILNIYNLYDETIETYVAQYMNTHDNLMKRDCERIYETSKNAYGQSPMSPQAGLYKYAKNYVMYKTATFDDQTGIYTSLDVKIPLINFGVFQLEDFKNSSLDLIDTEFNTDNNTSGIINN